MKTDLYVWVEKRLLPWQGIHGNMRSAATGHEVIAIFDATIPDGILIVVYPDKRRRKIDFIRWYLRRAWPVNEKPDIWSTCNFVLSEQLLGWMTRRGFTT